MVTRSFAAFALVPLAMLAWERPADACSIASGGNGYVQELTITTAVADDLSSAKACDYDLGTCGTRARYTGIKHVLVVTPKLGEQAKDGKLDTWLDTHQTTFTLKDATDGVVARSDTFPFSASFDQLGATVCVKTANKPGADGDAGAASEVCAPVTITSLDVTADDKTQHDAEVKQTCSSAAAIPPDGGTATDGGASPAAAADDGGCNSSGTSASTPIVLLAGLGLGIAAARRRKKS